MSQKKISQKYQVPVIIGNQMGFEHYSYILINPVGKLKSMTIIEWIFRFIWDKFLIWNYIVYYVG